MQTYILRDSQTETEIEAASLAEARTRAKEWAREGDYDAECFDSGTIWIEVQIIAVDADGDETIETVVTVALDPEAPECYEGGEHEWSSPFEIVGGIKENPGVWGHGGGVVISEVCLLCGCKKTTDTWATNPDNGEQGLTSVQYEAEHYADKLTELATAEGARIGREAAEASDATEWAEAEPDWESLDELVRGAYRQQAEYDAEEAFTAARSEA